MEKHQLPTRKLARPIPIYNADGTLNKGGTIKEYAEIQMIIQDHVEIIQFTISDLGEADVFIGYEWLKKHNPDVDWGASTLFFTRCPDECNYITTLDDLDTDPEEHLNHVHFEEGEKLFVFDIEGYMSNRRTFMGDSQENIFKQKVPLHYSDYKDVFDKEDFDHLPDRRVWDHAIKLDENFKPVDCKVYPLNPSEQKALEEFIEENLSSRWIRPSRHQWHPRSSSSKSLMESYILHRIIRSSMKP